MIHVPRDVEYVYFCDNETVDGTEFKGLPAVDDNDALFVSDMSSNFMSRPVDWTRYAAVWAGVQKNFGTAGLACVIVRRDQLGCAAETVPQMLDWSVYARNNSLQNTPPVLQFYTAMLMARWVDEQGGLAEMDRRAKERSALLYDTIDSMGDFYVSRIAPEARSRMNVVFTLADETLLPVFVKEAEAQAAKILAEANTKAQDVEKNAMTEISLAGKQALSKIKAEISSMIIAKSTAPAVKAATLDPEFVKQMLLTVAKNWSGADSSKNQLKALLPEAEQKAFEATFEAAAKELLAAGVEVGYSKEVRTGFKVGAKDGGYYISFSDQDFDALLKEYLRDKVYKMLYNA